MKSPLTKRVRATRRFCRFRKRVPQPVTFEPRQRRWYRRIARSHACSLTFHLLYMQYRCTISQRAWILLEPVSPISNDYLGVYPGTRFLPVPLGMRMPPGTSCTPFTTGIKVRPSPHPRRGVGQADQPRYPPANTLFSDPNQESGQAEVGQVPISTTLPDERQREPEERRRR